MDNCAWGVKRICSHKTFKETPRRRGRFSRSSSRSRCSSRNSAYASDAELAEELSECVRDLVKEVKELVHRSRDPSPVLTRNPSFIIEMTFVAISLEFQDLILIH